MAPVLQIEPIRFWEIPAITRMVYANMTGVDVEFTRLTETPLRRAFSYLLVPLYLLTAGRGFKAVHRREIAGCAYYHLRRSSGLVFNVNVNRGHRRRGVATALMQHLEAQVRRAGRAWSGLQVDEDNLPAQRLYQRLGYRPYHPYFLLSTRPALPLPRAGAAVQLAPLSRREGSHCYGIFLRKERQAGDAWAAAVVQADYQEALSDAGRFWEITRQGEKVGCLYLESHTKRQRARLLLQPASWGVPALNEGIYRELLAATGKTTPMIELHFGSSMHYEAALCHWQERGFLPQRKARILMLKALT